MVSASAIIFGLIGALAVLTASIIDFWIAATHKDTAVQKELTAAGALILLGGLFSFIFPPIGFLLVIVAMIMNFVLSVNEKDDNNHNALIASGILSIIGVIVIALALLYQVAKTAQSHPELVSAVLGPEVAAPFMLTKSSPQLSSAEREFESIYTGQSWK